MSLQVTIREEPGGSLDAYASISSAFEVRSVLEVNIADGLRGVSLFEQALAAPRLKNYDVLEGGPRSWPARFDTGRWLELVACVGTERVGGALIVYDDPSIEMLEGRKDLAVLWDLRVARGHRGQGVGRQLFRAAERWARERGYRELKVETQNVNVTACRFYASMGCRLGALDRFAYPNLPEEVQLLWFKAL
jgi:GNAT superfamily N-acetyltransferase